MKHAVLTTPSSVEVHTIAGQALQLIGLREQTTTVPHRFGLCEAQPMGDRLEASMHSVG